MSRAPFVLSAAAIFCASSYLALADEQRAIAARLGERRDCEFREQPRPASLPRLATIAGMTESPSASWLPRMLPESCRASGRRPSGQSRSGLTGGARPRAHVDVFAAPLR